MGWDIEEEFDAERSGWAARVRSMIPRIEEDEMVLLRRIEKKFDTVHKGKAQDLPDPRERKGDESSGSGGNEVTPTEPEESGFVGAFEQDRNRGGT